MPAVLAAGLLASGPFVGRARAEDGGKDGSRGERMERTMKEKLGLTDDQAVKLQAAWKAHKDAIKPLREQSKEAARKLESEIRDLSSEKEIQATLEQLDANRKAMTAERQKLEASTASILKPSQRAKLRLLFARRMKRGRHGKGGHQARRAWGEHRRGDDGHGDRDGDR